MSGPARQAVWVIALCGGAAWMIAHVAPACSTDSNAEAEVPSKPRRAGDFRSEVVSHAMRAADGLIQTRGFAPDGIVHRGFLVEQGSHVAEISLRGGDCYVLTSRGSTALQELDLQLFDSGGSDVAQDAQTGPGAAVRYCPTRSGTYYAAVTAASGAGLFALRVYRGPAGVTVRLDDLFSTPTKQGGDPSPP